MMAVVAVVNGVLREMVLVPRIDDYRAHLLSTALLIAVIIILRYAYRRGTGDRRCCLGVLMVGFEFLVGTPVEAILAQYDVLAGQVWILVPLTLLVASLLFGSIFASNRV